MSFFYWYQCRECSTTATGPVNASEPPGWGYDWDECEWLCPEHAPEEPADEETT